GTGGARRVPDEADRAAALGWLAACGLARGAAVPAREALPVYVRDKVALTTAEREARGEVREGAAFMSAGGTPDAWQPAEPVLRAITLELLDTVLAIEVEAYTFPWTRGNFVDALAAGYVMRALVVPGGPLVGYYVAMPGVDEMHLLNVTVSPLHQGQGHARRL